MAEQTFIVGVCLAAEIQVEHGILFPFPWLESVDGEAAEKFTASLEICLDCGEEQTLAETARAPEKIEDTLACKTVYIYSVLST